MNMVEEKGLRPWFTLVNQIISGNEKMVMLLIKIMLILRIQNKMF